MVNVSEYFTCSMVLIVIHPTGRPWSAARYHAQRNSEAACRWVFLEWAFSPNKHGGDGHCTDQQQEEINDSEGSDKRLRMIKKSSHGQAFKNYHLEFGNVNNPCVCFF